MTTQIAAVSVNHNTSPYMELMLRSLYARHRPPRAFALTIYDNASTDDGAGLRQYAAAVGVPIVATGLTTATAHNSHGELLRRFVLDNPACSHYLFLDADVCFVEDETIPALLAELEQHPRAFGIGPRMSWDGVSEVPAELRRANPDICDARLHPCCALLRNTPLLRQLAETVGFAAVQYLWAERAEYLDTMKLFTQVMRTHGQHHRIGAPMVQHFFAVSYEWDDRPTREHKARLRDQRLAELRG